MLAELSSSVLYKLGNVTIALPTFTPPVEEAVGVVANRPPPPVSSSGVTIQLDHVVLVCCLVVLVLQLCTRWSLARVAEATHSAVDRLYQLAQVQGRLIPLVHQEVQVAVRDVESLFPLLDLMIRRSGESFESLTQSLRNIERMRNRHLQWPSGREGLADARPVGRGRGRAADLLRRMSAERREEELPADPPGWHSRFQALAARVEAQGVPAILGVHPSLNAVAHRQAAAAAAAVGEPIVVPAGEDFAFEPRRRSSESAAESAEVSISFLSLPDGVVVVVQYSECNMFA